MPAFPERHARRQPEPIERYRDPSVYPTAVKGALVGLVAGTVLWAAAIVVTNLAYRWWVG